MGEKSRTVTVHATGVVKETGKKFWSTKDPGQKPFTYQAGVGAVITGWDQGLLGMHLNEERKLTIPAHEGYGAVSSGGSTVHVVRAAEPVGLRAAASGAFGLIRSALPVLGHLHELGLLGDKGAVSGGGSTVHVVRAAEPVGLGAASSRA